MQRKLLGISNVDFDATGQLLIIYSAFIKHLRKHGNKQSSASLLIKFKKSYDSLRKEVLYNILIEFCTPIKLVRLMKMCLTETSSRVWVGKNLSDMFPIRNSLKQVDALSPLLFNFDLEHAIKTVEVNQDGLKLNGTHKLLGYADDDSILGGSVRTIKENAEALVVAINEIGLEVMLIN